MEKQVEFKVGVETLRGKLFIPKGNGPFPGVIFFHGSGSKGETYYEASEILAKNGILAFMFNFRGCGKSDGKFEDQTIGMGIEDAKTALKLFLSFPELDKSRVGIAGSSYGGFLTALISDSYDFKSIALIVPAAYSPDKLETFHTDDIKQDKFEDSPSYDKIAKFNKNLIIFRSELDEILREGTVEKYVKVSTNASRKEYVILKGAGHVIRLYPKAKKVMLDKLLSWFKETL